MNYLRKWLIISLALSIVSITAVMLFTISSGTVTSLTHMNPILLFAAISFQFLSWLAWGRRMQVMSEALGRRIPFKDAVAIVLSNLFAASITPAHIGGEVTRIQLLRRFNLSVGDASAVVFGERMLDALFLGMVAPIGFILFQDKIKSNVGLTTLFAAISIIFFIIFFATLYAMAKPKNLKLIAANFRWLIMRFRGERRTDEILNRVFQEIDIFHNSLKIYLNEGKRALSKGFVYTVTFWMFQFSIASLILVGFGSQPWIIRSFFAQTVLMMIAMVPLTPGNSGIAEISTASIYSTFISISILGVFIITWRFVSYYLNILVGGFVSLKVLKDTQILEGTIEEVIDGIE